MLIIYEREQKVKRQAFAAWKGLKQKNLESLFRLQEFASRKNVILLGCAFKCFRQLLVKKDLRLEFFNKLSIFYYDYIMHKYFSILRQQKQRRIRREQLNTAALELWKRNI